MKLIIPASVLTFLTRHQALFDRHAPFQEHPLALEHFPPASLLRRRVKSPFVDSLVEMRDGAVESSRSLR